MSKDRRRADRQSPVKKAKKTGRGIGTSADDVAGRRGGGEVPAVEESVRTCPLLTPLPSGKAARAGTALGRISLVCVATCLRCTLGCCARHRRVKKSSGSVWQRALHSHHASVPEVCSCVLPKAGGVLKVSLPCSLPVRGQENGLDGGKSGGSSGRGTERGRRGRGRGRGTRWASGRRVGEGRCQHSSYVTCLYQRNCQARKKHLIFVLRVRISACTLLPRFKHGRNSNEILCPARGGELSPALSYRAGTAEELGACWQVGRLLVSDSTWIFLVPAHVSLSTSAVQTLGLVFKDSVAEIHFSPKPVLLRNCCRGHNAEIRTWGPVFTLCASWKPHLSLESRITNYTASQLRSFMYI